MASSTDCRRSGSSSGSGDTEGHAGVAQAGFGADEALAHGGGWDEEDGGDVIGGEAEDGLKDQRRAHAALDGGVGAGEHQREAAVGDDGAFLGGRFYLVGDQFHMLLPGGSGLATANGIGLAAARDRQQPGIGILGNAVDRPHTQRGGEGLAEGILGARHISGAGGKEGDEAAVAFARHALGSTASLVGGGHLRLPSATKTGRISIEPYLLDGQRLAQAMAPSRSSASTKK